MRILQAFNIMLYLHIQTKHMVNKELTVLVAVWSGFSDCVLLGTADRQSCPLHRGAA